MIYLNEVFKMLSIGLFFGTVPPYSWKLQNNLSDDKTAYK